MKTQAQKTNKKQLPIQRAEQQASTGSTATIEDNRPRSVYQRKLQRMMNASNDDENNPIQRKPNNTGLPGNLKTGIENLSGYSMDDVKVHYNSSKPAQLQAHAYAQGTNIHLAPGQEKHLPHEAWHVVQQKQGRVKPTMQFKGKVNINDDAGLEREADVMGERALHSLNFIQVKKNKKGSLIHGSTMQLVGIDPNKLNVIGEIHPESNRRRPAEKDLANQTFPNRPGPNYWEENEFVVLNEQRERERYGDRMELQLVESIGPSIIDDPLKMYEGLDYKKMIRVANNEGEDKINRQVFYDSQIKYLTFGLRLVLQSFANLDLRIESHVRNETQTDDNALFEQSVSNFLDEFFPKEITGFQTGESFYNHVKGRVKDQIKLIYDDETSSREVLALVAYLKKAFNLIYEYNLEKFSKGYEKKISGEQDDHKITYLRSIYMHEAANKMRDVRGIWKVGDQHVTDILKYRKQSDFCFFRKWGIPYGFFRSRPMHYNLMTKSDFDTIMNQYRQGNNQRRNNQVTQIADITDYHSLLIFFIENRWDIENAPEFLKSLTNDQLRELKKQTRENFNFFWWFENSKGEGVAVYYIQKRLIELINEEEVRRQGVSCRVEANPSWSFGPDIF